MFDSVFSRTDNHNPLSKDGVCKLLRCLLMITTARVPFWRWDYNCCILSGLSPATLCRTRMRTSQDGGPSQSSALYGFSAPAFGMRSGRGRKPPALL